MSFLRQFWQNLFSVPLDNSISSSNPISRAINPALAPLYQLMTDRQLVEVAPEQGQRIYQTMLIAIDESRELLWLDELFPPQRLIEVGQQVTLRSKRQQEVMTITTKVAALGTELGINSVAVQLPKEASYLPRRRFNRVAVSAATPINAKVRSVGSDPLFGSVEDVSLGGMRVFVPGNHIRSFNYGSVLPLCEINVNNQLRFNCKAKVKASRICRLPYQGTRLHLEFIDIDQHDISQLAYFLPMSLASNSDKDYAA